MNKPFQFPDRAFWQTSLALTFFFNLGMLAWSVSRWLELKVVLYRSVWGLALGLYLGILAGCLWAFFALRRADVAARVEKTLSLDRFQGLPWRMLGIGVFGLVVWAIPYFKFTYRIGEVIKKSTQDPVLSTIIFYWLVWWLVLIAAGGLKVALRASWAGGFAAALVAMGVSYELFERLHGVTSYPFSLGWSETSRYFYASLPFSEMLYGQQLPLSTLHPSRYLLQSLAYLVPGADVTIHRAWQVFLWVALTGSVAVALAWRVLRGPAERWLFAGLVFLFLLRVGVYYHLMPILLLPLIFVSAQRPWQSLAAVLVASAWAGISRVNWFPVPAMLAIIIYLLEEPIGEQPIWRYLRQPFTWAVSGLAVALAAQLIYIPLSGNAENAKSFASSFFSDLLWYRLWPNDLYTLGIVPAILIVSAPALASLAFRAWRGPRLHWLRWLGVSSILLVLFGGGLVVSVKIGGGGDLHNMDAFAALLIATTGWFIGDQVAGEKEAPEAPQRGFIPWAVIALGLLIPLIFLIPALSPLPRWNKTDNQRALTELKNIVEAANGPVLFINERHLAIFKQIRTPVLPEYEGVSLMEMAMSNNQDVLGQFYADLKSERFALIVAGKQNLVIKTEGAFFEESNVWNSRISTYILCYYQPIQLIETDETRLEVYAPRFGQKDCP